MYAIRSYYVVVVLGGSSKSAGLFVILFQIINQLFILIPSIIKNFSELAVSRMRYKEYMSYMMLKEPETLDGNSSIRNNNSIQVQVNNFRITSYNVCYTKLLRANNILDFEDDERTYDEAISIIKYFRAEKGITLLSNNPDKLRCFKKKGIIVNDVIPIHGFENEDNKRYLNSKLKRIANHIDFDEEKLS